MICLYVGGRNVVEENWLRNLTGFQLILQQCVLPKPAFLRAESSVHTAVSLLFLKIEVTNWMFLEHLLKTLTTPDLTDLREVKSGLSALFPEEINAEAHTCLCHQASPLILIPHLTVTPSLPFPDLFEFGHQHELLGPQLSLSCYKTWKKNGEKGGQEVYM